MSSDPAQVEEIIQSTAKLAIHAVAGGPYETDQAALQANSGVIPAGLDAGARIGGGGRAGPGLAAEAGERGGRYGLPRCAAFDRTRTAGRTSRFTLTTEAGDRFYKYTEAHSSDERTPGSMAIVLDNKVRKWRRSSRRFATAARLRAASPSSRRMTCR